MNLCGIVGVAGDINKKEKDVFRTLLVVDSLRGAHSTGVATINGAGEFSVSKKKGNPYELFDSREFSSLMNTISYGLIGHNRYATKGTINNINAHPFEFRDVVGVHNGTIRGQHRLIDHRQFEVDSENIYHSIQEIGLEETLKVLDGAYALSYWDKRDESLVLLRNKERPLCYCVTEDERTMFWASEPNMLTFALAREGVKHLPIVDVTEGIIHRFEIQRKFKPDPILVRRSAFTPYEAPKTTYYNKNTNPYYQPGNKGTNLNAKKTQALPSSSEKSSEVKEAKRLVNHPQKYLNKHVEFIIDEAAITKSGQHYLSGRLVENESLEVRVFAEKEGALWDEMLTNWDVTFSGKVSNYLRYNDKEQHIAISLGSIRLVEDEEDDEEPPFVGFNGVFLDKKGFEMATDKGCAWCSEKDVINQAKEIHWLAFDEFICKDCLSHDDVKEYIYG